MPDENEQDALSKIKAYLDAGHNFDAIRQAGWASWIDHLEAKGYDLRTGQLALRPPDESAIPEPTPGSRKPQRVFRDKRLAAALLAGLLMIVLVIIGAAMLGGSSGNGDSSVVSHTPTKTAPPTLTNEEEEATAESAAATADAATHKLATARARPSSTPRPTDTPRPTVSPPYKLALISASCTRSSQSYTTCEGFVKNLTSQPMESIEAVVVYYEDDTPVASDSALIDYRPLLPGQQSPWSVIATYNPAFTGWRVEFKEFFGGTILTRDDRP